MRACLLCAELQPRVDQHQEWLRRAGRGSSFRRRLRFAGERRASRTSRSLPCPFRALRPPEVPGSHLPILHELLEGRGTRREGGSGAP